MSFKKILFLVFVLFQLTPLSVLAADTLTGAECTALGGTCNSYYNQCDASSDLVGVCGGTFNNTGCCIPKQNAVSTEAECTSRGGSCNTMSEVCSSNQTSIGTCPGTVNDSACCQNSTLNGPGAVNVGTNYTPLEYIPFLNGTTFQDYILGVYILGMVLVVLAAVFMLVIGGFQYLTSAGNTSALSSAKHTIEGALFGLALALVAYLILYVINPDLTKLNISTFQPLAPQAGGTTGGGGSTGGGGATGGPGSVQVPPGTKGCYDCTKVTSIPCKDSSSCQLNKTFLAKLEAANSQLKDITITEAWPPTVTHQSACHSNGTCADIRTSPSDVTNMSRYYAALKSAGLGTSFLEVGRGDSCVRYTTNGIPCIITKGTGVHFHVR